jgi:predicted DNA-binding protein
MKDQRISVRLPGELRQRLRQSAHRNGVRESELIREAVERQFAAEDQEITTYELAQRSGLVGVVSRAPKDLSTNRRHLEGFGRRS